MAEHPGLLKNSKVPTHSSNKKNYTDIGNGHGKNGAVASKLPISEKEAAEIAAKTENDVAAMKFIFPNYGSGFLEACLLVIVTHTERRTHMSIECINTPRCSYTAIQALTHTHIYTSHLSYLYVSMYP